MANTAIFTRTSSALGARLRALLEDFRAARRQRADYDRTVKELTRLTDRELLDLGLSRYEIHHVVHKHVYGK